MSAKVPTFEQYVDGSCLCPVCGFADPDWDEEGPTMDDLTYQLTVKCHACESEWLELYKMSDIKMIKTKGVENE